MELAITLFIIMVAGIAIAATNDSDEEEGRVSVMYGYPKYRRTWLTIYHYRESDRWVFEWDDLFDSGRPKSWGPFSDFRMNDDKESGATAEEFKKARKLLKDDGLI